MIAPELTDEQKERYEVKQVGSFAYTNTPTYKVTCRRCSHVLSTHAQRPLEFIEKHEKLCLSITLELLEEHQKWCDDVQLLIQREEGERGQRRQEEPS